MAQAKRKPIFTSPKGVAVFPWLNNPDTKWREEGEYKVSLRLSMEAFTTTPMGKAFGGKSFKDWIDGLVDQAVVEAKKEYPQAKRSIRPIYPYKEEMNDEGDPTGHYLVTVKQNAKIKRRDGTVAVVSIDLFDAAGDPLEAPVYGGSAIKVAFTVRNIWVAANKEAGIRLDLRAVQVLQLAKSSRAATDFGFEDESADEEGPSWDEDGDPGPSGDGGEGGDEDEF